MSQRDDLEQALTLAGRFVGGFEIQVAVTLDNVTAAMLYDLLCIADDPDGAIVLGTLIARAWAHIDTWFGH